MTRRERITLVGVILEELGHAQHEPGDVRLTRLAMRCNLAYDHFREIFEQLQGKGLVGGPPYALTEAGRDLLKKYRGLNDTLRELGMTASANADARTRES